MLDVFNTPTNQNTNYVEFLGGGTTRDWVKPRGVSMVRFMLIGAGQAGGSGGAATTGGGYGGCSGAVTSWIGPALFVPDILRVVVGAGGKGAVSTYPNGASGGATTIVYQAKDGTGYTLLTANGGASGAAAATSTGPFAAAGITKSTAGAAFSTGAVNAFTFLTSGSQGQGAVASGVAPTSQTPQYSYPAIPGSLSGSTTRPEGGSGYFVFQPVMVGAGAGAGGYGIGVQGGVGGSSRGAIGCGGGGGGYSDLSGSSNNPAGGDGGDGAVFIWSW